MDNKRSFNLALTGTAVAVSIMTGGLTLGGLIAGVGANLLTDLVRDGWPATRNRWLAKGDPKSDPLNRAYARAFIRAANSYKKTFPYHHIRPELRELCREGLAQLEQDIHTLFQETDTIAAYLPDGDPDRAEAEMGQILADYFYGYPDSFLKHLQTLFAPRRLADYFSRELQQDEPARAAFQLLLLQTVKQQTAVLLSQQKELSTDVQAVRRWLENWQATPPEQQQVDFEAAHNTALDRLAADIKTHTTTEHDKTRALIAERVQAAVTFPIIHLPPANPHFVGRVEHLETLTSGSGKTTITQTISGLGGVGKSQLMLHFAHRQRDAYDIIWWLRVDEALAEDFIALGRQLRLPVDGLEQAPAMQLIRNWLNGSDKRWLLLCDNADKTEPRDLRASLPTNPQGRILITSRNSRWRGLGGVLRLDVFTPAEAAAFWRERLNQPAGLAQSRRLVQSELAELAEELGYLPLALEQAAAYIDHNQVSAADYLRLFQTRRRELWANTEPPDDYHATIATTWDIGFAEARQTPGAADLLHLCCFLAPNEIPLDLLVEQADALPDELAAILADPLARNAALTALERYALLTRSDGLLSIHRLVQTVARDRLEDEEAEEWTKAAVEAVLQSLPDWTRLHEWQAGAQFLPHMTTAADLALARERVKKVGAGATGGLLDPFFSRARSPLFLSEFHVMSTFAVLFDITSGF